MNHDFYTLFSHFWWLLFPLLGMGMGMFGLWSRHARANRALDMIKSYVDQGKEPPPQLLEVLRLPESDRRADRWTLPERNWVPFGLFAGLAAGFIFGIGMGEPSLFVGLIMAGMAAGFLANIVSGQRQKNIKDDQRTPPP